MNIIDKYVKEFNEYDTEQVINAVPNVETAQWMKREIPKFECPDKELERIYYFRWWTYRKHIKKAESGYAISEFLLDVPWADKYNIINAAAGHHISEGKWLKNSAEYLGNYIQMLLDKDGCVDCHKYSGWLLYAIKEYFDTVGYDELTDELLDKMIWYSSVWDETHLLEADMYWSKDHADAMEYSISGTDENMNVIPGVRPTLNSYMYADCITISYFAKKLGNEKIEKEFYEKALRIKETINNKLWCDGFYRAFHYNDPTELFKGKKPPMEEIGYIPWMFNIPPKGRENVFAYLRDTDIFDAKTGIATADMRDERFLYEADHECLWNGYVWPFATSQTLKSLINVIRNYDGEKYKDLFCYHLKKYAVSHFKINNDGTTAPWIDEVLHPFKQEWTSVTYLKEHNFPAPMGPEGRGQYYNHSTFCDLVISGLCGVCTEGGEVKVKPIVPDDWEYFKLTDVYVNNKHYNITYDKHKGCTIEVM